MRKVVDFCFSSRNRNVLINASMYFSTMPSFDLKMQTLQLYGKNIFLILSWQQSKK